MSVVANVGSDSSRVSPFGIAGVPQGTSAPGGGGPGPPGPGHTSNESSNGGPGGNPPSRRSLPNQMETTLTILPRLVISFPLRGVLVIIMTQIQEMQEVARLVTPVVTPAVARLGAHPICYQILTGRKQKRVYLLFHLCLLQLVSKIGRAHV